MGASAAARPSGDPLRPSIIHQLRGGSLDKNAHRDDEQWIDSTVPCGGVTLELAPRGHHLSHVTYNQESDE